jgi:hypothetical protein
MDDTQILKALERRPLTVENLAHALGCSVDSMRERVQRLWTKGYIETTHAASPDPAGMGLWLLAQIIPMRQHKHEQCVPSTSQTYFLLTFKGHLRLHPILSFGTSQ